MFSKEYTKILRMYVSTRGLQVALYMRSFLITKPTRGKRKRCLKDESNNILLTLYKSMELEVY